MFVPVKAIPYFIHMPPLSVHQLQANPVAALQVWLRQMAVPVCNNTVRQTVENHPNFPSLLSMSEALNEWQVDKFFTFKKCTYMKKLLTHFASVLLSKEQMKVIKGGDDYCQPGNFGNVNV